MSAKLFVAAGAPFQASGGEMSLIAGPGVTAHTLSHENAQNQLAQNGLVTQASAPLFLDSAFTPFVTASLEEIRHAQRLRERIENRYLNRPTPAVSFWSILPKLTDRPQPGRRCHSRC